MTSKSTEVISVDDERDEVSLVLRTEVVDGKPYPDYKYILRHDFFHCCAYCTISESEAQGYRFTIDHYEPRSVRPELTDTYKNLMWCCDTCNELKGNRCPPESARQDGVRFFRPDVDRYSDHFRRSGLRLASLSKLGDFNIDALDLNRQALRRLREIRSRLTDCESAIAAGFMALRNFKVDRLPPAYRMKVFKLIGQLQKERDEIVQIIEQVLRENAASPLLDPDEDKVERTSDRKRKLAQTEALYPGDWRAKKKSPFSGSTA
ncbi:HNH endonuclease [Mesorhizobium sp. Cs1299R1N1]|uniref:HNH endonuclease n=1 Tax=Mesorhizobium sp. Cs1299R1N1 TaxID=3015172 RepID=UPI00301C5980